MGNNATNATDPSGLIEPVTLVVGGAILAGLAYGALMYSYYQYEQAISLLGGNHGGHYNPPSRWTEADYEEFASYVGSAQISQGVGEALAYGSIAMAGAGLVPVPILGGAVGGLLSDGAMQGSGLAWGTQRSFDVGQFVAAGVAGAVGDGMFRATQFLGARMAISYQRPLVKYGFKLGAGFVDGVVTDMAFQGTALGFGALGLSAHKEYNVTQTLIAGGMGAGMGLFMKTCFTGETPILVEGGSKRADEIEVGDLLWSQDEFDPQGEVALKQVEEVFVRVAPVLNLHIEGQIIGTTAEHPFCVHGKGWVPAGQLEQGDLLQTDDKRLIPVEGIADSGEVTTVYNFRVADYHTYFVGSESWGFSVWAHNSYDEVFEGTQRRLLLADLLEQPGMHQTRTQDHHPFFRMFRDAIDRSGMGIGSMRGRKGRMLAQKLQKLELREHADLHRNWNNFVQEKGLHPALTVREGGRRVLTRALRDGEITPHDIYRFMHEFYSEYGNSAALSSLRRYGRRVGIDQTPLF